MLYKKVKNRLLFITLLLLVSLVVVFFSIKTLNNNLLYFKSPTDIFENQNIQFQKKIRLGGMVKKNSILVNNKEIKFIITDYKNEIRVPKILGLNIRTAIITLEKLGLKCRLDGYGEIAWQNPKAGTLVDKGTTCIVGLK